MIQVSTTFKSGSEIGGGGQIREFKKKRHIHPLDRAGIIFSGIGVLLQVSVLLEPRCHASGPHPSLADVTPN